MDNPRIIHAPMNGRRYTVTAPITQYDYGYLLLPEGTEELPATYEIDFSNDEHKGTSLTVYGGAEGAEVPEELIRTGKDVYAFYYFVGDGFGKTEFMWRLPNKCRPSRDGQTPTPTQQSSIDQLIVRSNDAVTSAEQSASDASASAQSAQGYASQAETAKSDAQTYANNAQASATSASQSAQASANSATASAQSASQSAQIKADVEDLADDAQGYAQASAQSASASANSASQAQGFAQSASASANSASGYASQADISANTASAKAQDASTSAQTASTKASESAQSASQALSYKTDAESAKTASQTAQGLAESARDDAIDAKTDAESARDEAQNIVDGINAKAEQIDQNTADIASLEADRYKPYAVDSASGAIASFVDGADNIPLKSLIVNIDPVQDTSSGDPSPENICPISGWTGMEIQRTRKNLLPINIWSGIPYNASTGRVFEPVMTDDSWTQKSDRITYNATTTYKALSLMTPLLPKGTYRLSIHKLSSGSVRYSRYALDKSYTVKFGTYTSSVTDISAAMTLEEDGYIAVRLDNSSFAPQTVEITIQVEVGDTETAYEPYQGQTIPISWQTEAGTVYGGKLDVLTGKLTVYPEYDSYNGETLTGEWISDRDVYAVGTTPTIGAQVVNIGADGTEYQLSPTDVKSLLGQNNIFSDTGDCAVEYRADTKLYIERLTAPDSADMVADANITSGQYFMVGNSLYKATANIANGGQIVVGTNATRVSLAQALNEINA